MDKDQIREVIAKRAAKELHDGDVVNLGIGIPTMIPNYLPEDHLLCLTTDCHHLTVSSTDSYHRWLIYHYFVIANDDGVRCSEVNCNLLRKRK